MQLAVVVVSYNVQALLRECLRSLYASLERTPELAAAVWVVDNASADGSAAMVRAEFPQTHLLACPENLGYSTANNVALQLLGFQPAAGEARPLSAYRWATDLPQPAGWPRRWPSGGAGRKSSTWARPSCRGTSAGSRPTGC